MRSVITVTHLLILFHTLYLKPIRKVSLNSYGKKILTLKYFYLEGLKNLILHFFTKFKYLENHAYLNLFFAEV